ncbi:MAG: hypothetical protein ACRYFR_02950 [Janthinobacterium lividum]
MDKIYKLAAWVGCCALLTSFCVPGASAKHPNKSRYRPGWYTLADGTRHVGLLHRYVSHTDSLTKVELEPSKSEPPQVLGPSELRSVVIGTDSMVTIRLLELADTVKYKPVTDLVHVVMVGKATLLMRHELLVSTNNGASGSGGMYGMPTTVAGGKHYENMIRWAYQKPGAPRCYLLPWGEDYFKRTVAPLFLDYPDLCQRIRGGEAAWSDVKRIFYAYNLRADIDQVSYAQAEHACRMLVWD